MFIAISQRNEKSQFGDHRDILENNYINYYEKFGIKLITIPNSSKSVKKYLEDLPIKGIILSGGGDVNPRLYNQEPKYITNFSELRDKTEGCLLEIAIERNLPVFCNCRGMQFMNVFFGGSLIQDIEKEFSKKIKHVNSTHLINVVDDYLNEVLGKDKFSVNSYHNQGITLETLSKELDVFAIAEDEIIEGVYHKKYPIVGVQWHPERENFDKNLNSKIIKAFVERRLFWSRE